MKAPDKKIGIKEADVIYIGEENIKFIRKDALLEWANAELESLHLDSSKSITDAIVGRALRGLIDKLNSM